MRSFEPLPLLTKLATLILLIGMVVYIREHNGWKISDSSRTRTETPAGGDDMYSRDMSLEEPPPDEPDLPKLVRRCDTSVLLHEISSADMNDLYKREGPPLHLADAFISDTCGTKKNVPHDSCFQVNFIFNVKVFEFENGTKLEGAKRIAQASHQKRVYRQLTSPTVNWSCIWDGDSKSTSAGPVAKDNHAHSLAIKCGIPDEILSKPVDATGRLSDRVRLVAEETVAGNKSTKPVVFSISNVPVCTIQTGSAGSLLHDIGSVQSLKADDIVKSRSAGPYLASCTMVTEIDPMFDTAELTRLWVDYMLGSGVQHILVYVDANKRESQSGAPKMADLERDIFRKLSSHIKSRKVEIILFHLRGRGWLETQQMMETHCIYRYKHWAKWIAHDDIDEFFQPLSGQGSLSAVVKSLESQATAPVSAFQVPQSFWGHMPHDGIQSNSLKFWDMAWRSSGKFKNGREKLILNVSNVEYISVHMVTTGSKMHRTDPETEVRLNHFRRHFKGLGAEDQNPSWKNSGIGPDPLYDTSFRKCALMYFHKQLNQ